MLLAVVKSITLKGENDQDRHFRTNTQRGLLVFGDVKKAGFIPAIFRGWARGRLVGCVVFLTDGCIIRLFAGRGLLIIK